MPVNATKKPIYESFSMISPNGEFMCHINEKRANWYVGRGLADWIDEKTFQIKFEPKGNGKKEMLFYNQKLENRCVVCGDNSNNLNKHHVVPYVFRSRFPNAYKESNHHDILVTCVNCHERYEALANQYKKKLAEEIGVSMDRKMSLEQKYNKKILSAKKILQRIDNDELRDENGKCLIPEEKIKEFREIVKCQLLEEPIFDSGPVWADKIIEKVMLENNLFDFIKKWRQHFVDNTNPKFLPNYWSVEHPLEKININND